MKKYNSVEEFFSDISPEYAEALDHLRKLIKKTAPDTTEKINYGMPTFIYKGKNLVSYMAYEKHLSFYTDDGVTIERHKDLLKGLKVTGKAAIQFDVDNPIPDEIIVALVQARMEVIDELVN